MEIWPANQQQTDFARVILILTLVMGPALLLPPPAGRWIAFGLAVVFGIYLAFDWWVRPNAFPESQLNDEQKFALAMQSWLERQGTMDGDRIRELTDANEVLQTRLGQLAAALELQRGEVEAIKAAQAGGAPS